MSITTVIMQSTYFSIQSVAKSSMLESLKNLQLTTKYHRTGSMKIF